MLKPQKHVDLIGLYYGFVNTFNSLLLPVEDDSINEPQETHAIVDHFRRVGLALGFYPWCEAKLLDLVWFPEKQERLKERELFHLETENFYVKNGESIERTAKKLLESSAPFRMGLVWSDHADVDGYLESLMTKSKGKGFTALMVVRTYEDTAEGHVGEAARLGAVYRVRAFFIQRGKSKELPEARLINPTGFAFQTMVWG